jgi:signal transduction histidine kinase
MNTQQHLMEVIDREQARIGHDLHDGVGQLLSGIASLTESLEADLEGAQKQDAHRIYQLVREAIDQVRQLSHTLVLTESRSHRITHDSCRIYQNALQT